MTGVILALNAGSSSIKFSLFVPTSGMNVLSLLYQGEVKGIGSEPRFLVCNSSGQWLVDARLTVKAGDALGHEEALGVLLEWIERHEAGLTLIGAGHRVVHGGTLL